MNFKSPGKDHALLIMLIALGLLFLTLWFTDPLHRRTGKSRTDWPRAPLLH